MDEEIPIYTGKQVEKILSIYRIAGHLLKDSKNNLYINEGKHVNSKIYSELERILEESREFPSIFLDFNSDLYEGENVGSSRIALISFFYDMAKSSLEDKSKTLHDPSDDIPF